MNLACQWMRIAGSQQPREDHQEASAVTTSAETKGIHTPSFQTTLMVTCPPASSSWTDRRRRRKEVIRRTFSAALFRKNGTCSPIQQGVLDSLGIRSPLPHPPEAKRCQHWWWSKVKASISKSTGWERDSNCDVGNYSFVLQTHSGL